MIGYNCFFFFLIFEFFFFSERGYPIKINLPMLNSICLVYFNSNQLNINVQLKSLLGFLGVLLNMGGGDK